MIKGDKIRLVKPMGAFTNIGEICEITDIKENDLIYFKFGGAHLGCMSYDEFEKYFELVEANKPKRKWTEWETTIIDYTYFLRAGNTFIPEMDWNNLYYRDNGRCIQLKITVPGFHEEEISLKSYAICSDSDTFDFDKGFNLALRRLFAKIMSYVAKWEAEIM